MTDRKNPEGGHDDPSEPQTEIRPIDASTILEHHPNGQTHSNGHANGNGHISMAPIGPRMVYPNGNSSHTNGHTKNGATVRSIESRMPPHDLGAEAAVLSAVLVDNAAIGKVRHLLAPPYFYSEAHRRIYEAAATLHDGKRAIDPVSVASELRAAGRLEQVGGMAYVTAVINAAPAAVNVLTYAQTVVRMAHQRDLLASCQFVESTIYARAFNERSSTLQIRASLELLDRPFDQDVQSTENLFSPLENISFLVPGLGIAPGAPVIIGGYGFSGKTVAVQSMALSVSAGRPLWGRYAVKCGRVLHVDYEQGSHLTKERYQRLAYGMNIDKSQLDSRLEAMIVPSIYLDDSAADSHLCRLGEGRTLVIIDSFRAATPRIDENSSEVRRPLDAAMRASEKTGCVFVFLHHARKPAEGQLGGNKMSFRGSSGFFDGSGSAFVLTSQGKGEPTFVTHEKDRARGVTEPDFTLRVEDVEGRRGLRVVHQDATEAPPSKAKDRYSESSKLREERDKQDAERRERAFAAQKRRKSEEAAVDDRALLDIIARCPGIGLRQLRTAMRTELGTCSHERVDDAIYRKRDALLSDPGTHSNRSYRLRDTPDDGTTLDDD